MTADRQLTELERVVDELAGFFDRERLNRIDRLELRSPDECAALMIALSHLSSMALTVRERVAAYAQQHFDALDLRVLRDLVHEETLRVERQRAAAAKQLALLGTEPQGKA